MCIVSSTIKLHLIHLSLPGLAVGLVVRGADVRADGVAPALAHHRGVAHVHRLVERLRGENIIILLIVLSISVILSLIFNDTIICLGDLSFI